MTVLAHVGGMPVQEVGLLGVLAFAPLVVLVVVVLVVRRLDVRAGRGPGSRPGP